MKGSAAAMLLLVACAHARPAPTAAPFIPQDLELRPESIGVVRVHESDDRGYRVTLIFPHAFVAGSWDKFAASDQYWKDSAPITFKGELELFDGQGPLGRISPPAGAVRFWCENDGGTQYRPELTLTLSRSALSRPLRPVAELQGIAAFVRAASPPATSGPPPADEPRHGSVALRGDADGDGQAEVVVTTLPDDAGNCDGEPANNLTVTLWRGASAWPLRCCGP